MVCEPVDRNARARSQKPCPHPPRLRTFNGTVDPRSHVERGEEVTQVVSPSPVALARKDSHSLPAPSSTSFMSARSVSDSSACLLMAV